jgi:5-hydroxyisourate hydrolase-like protein (transthyretin family)
MKDNLVSLVLCAAMLSTAARGASEAGATGVISGVVVNNRGEPIAAAKVHALSTERRPVAALVKYVETDTDGRFLMGQVEYGSYRLYALKETDGYPDRSFSFYSNGLTFQATVSERSPHAEALIVVGPIAGRLTGLISDSATGQPLNGRLHLWRIKDPAIFFDTTVRAQYEILIPANNEVGMEVTVPGYEVWRYPGDPYATQSSPMLLRSDERKAVEIKLRPKLDR